MMELARRRVLPGLFPVSGGACGGADRRRHVDDSSEMARRTTTVDICDSDSMGDSNSDGNGNGGASLHVFLLLPFVQVEARALSGF